MKKLIWLVLLSFLISGVSADWPMFGRDAAHRCFVSDKLIPPLKVIKKISLNIKIKGSPIVIGKNIYLPSPDGNLYAVDYLQEKIDWNFWAGKPITSTPCWHKEMIYVLTTKGTLYAVYATGENAGQEKWHYETGLQGPSSPIIYNDLILLTGEGLPSKLICLTLEGDFKWEYPVSQSIFSTPVGIDDKVIFSACDGFLYCLDLKGTLRWKAKHFCDGFSSPFGVGKKVLYAPGSGDKNFYCFSLEDGRVDWKYTYQTSEVPFRFSSIMISPVATNGEFFYFKTNYYGQPIILRTIDAEGKEKWKQEVGYVKRKHEMLGAPVLTENYLYTADENGNIFCLDINENGKIVWHSKFDEEEFNSSLVVDNGRLFVVSSQGNIYVLEHSLSISAKKEKRTPSQSYPNPYNPECWIPVDSLKGKAGEIKIYNTLGQLVRKIKILPSQQPQSIYWDGKDSQGRTLSSGVYFYQLATKTKSSLKKAILLK